jgi:hypothetical protein
MNLHETLTDGRSIGNRMSVAFRLRQAGAPRSVRPADHLMATRRHRSLLLGTIVLGALLLLPAGASAGTCDLRDLLDAAANNRQISQHTQACYQEALAEVPADADGYSPNFRANLLAAMSRDARIRAETGDRTISRELQSELQSPATATAASVRGPVTNLLEGLGPAHVDEVPLPVVALGSLASLLLLAGLGTSLARVRARRAAR